MEVRISPEKRGPGFWKFNNSLLKDEVYLDLITNLLVSEIHSFNRGSPSFKWEFIKFKVRSVTINYSKLKASERRKHENEILKTISLLEMKYFDSSSAENLNNLNKARAELNELYDYKLQGIIIRSGARWVENGGEEFEVLFKFSKKE